MQVARVIGQAVATMKHKSLRGFKLLLVQPIHDGARPDGEPFLAIDAIGAGMTDTVLITSDGASARAIVKERASPVRWAVIGVCDQQA